MSHMRTAVVGKTKAINNRKSSKHSKTEPLSNDLKLSEYSEKLPIHTQRRYFVSLLFNFGHCMPLDIYLSLSG